MIKQKPILFSGPMIRALLREIAEPGTGKTTTRRILKKQPADLGLGNKRILEVADYCTGAPQHGKAYYWRENGCWNNSPAFKLPYVIGDLLWVREAFAWSGFEELAVGTNYRRCPERTGRDNLAIFRADNPMRADSHPAHGKTVWRPSIHLPKSVSRITLEVTDVKVERLNDISPTDAEAEGVEWLSPPVAVDLTNADEMERLGFVVGFMCTWDEIHGAGAYNKNPWVIAPVFTPHAINVLKFIEQREAA